MLLTVYGSVQLSWTAEALLLEHGVHGDMTNVYLHIS